MPLHSDVDSRSFTVEEARERFGEVLARAAGDKQHVVPLKDGEPVAAVIPIEALDVLNRAVEALEDAIDLREAKRVLEDENDEFVPWDEIEDELDTAPSE